MHSQISIFNSSVKMLAITTISFLFCFLISGFGGCCKTQAVLQAARGENTTIMKYEGSSLIFICPGEPVTVGWGVSGDVSSAKITDIGSVDVPTGMKTVYPQSDITYELVADGDCEMTSSVEINVVTQGDKVNISGVIIKGRTVYWEANLKEAFYSPQIKVTSIAMDIPTISGWTFMKTDLDGTVWNFAATNIAQTPWPTHIQLAGVWKLAPTNPTEIGNANPPFSIPFHVTLTCE